MKPTVPDVLPLVHQLYATPHGFAGGCLHVVLDDGNVDETCVAASVDASCETCRPLAEMLQAMSLTQRRKLRALRRMKP